MDIINVSKAPKYKLAKWLLVGVGSLVLLIGLVLSALTANVQASSISFASGNRIERSAGDDRWRMTVWTPETPLTVNTEPGNQTNTPITFTVINNLDGTIGTNYIEPIADVRSGRVAIIKLTANDQSYAYNKTVTLLVSCGGAKATLEIVILPPAERISVVITATEKNKVLDITNGKIQISRQTYITDPITVQGKVISHYQLNAALHVYGTEITDHTPFQEECTDEEEDVGVTLSERDRGMTGVTLLGGSRGILIDEEYLQPGSVYNFSVFCTYLGNYHTQPITIEITE